MDFENKMNKKGIIFDLDGTLWDVTEITYKSANEICKKYNLNKISIETIRNGFGKNKEDSAKLYFPNIDLNKSIKLIDEIILQNIQNLNKYGGNLYDKVEETLKQLSNNYKLFIVSNTAFKEYIEAFLKTSKTEHYFTDYMASGNINITKSEAIKLMIKKYNLDKCIYVGDTHIDKESANLANIKFIHAKYGFEKNLISKYSIKTIYELQNFLIKIDY